MNARKVVTVKLMRFGACMLYRIYPVGGLAWVELYIAPHEIDLPLTIDIVRAIGRDTELPEAARRIVFGRSLMLWTLEALCLERPPRGWEAEHVPEHTQRIIAARRGAPGVLS